MAYKTAAWTFVVISFGYLTRLSMCSCDGRWIGGYYISQQEACFDEARAACESICSELVTIRSPMDKEATRNACGIFWKGANVTEASRPWTYWLGLEKRGVLTGSWYARRANWTWLAAPEQDLGDSWTTWHSRGADSEKEPRPSEKTRHCGALMVRSGYFDWAARDCGERMPYICYSETGGCGSINCPPPTTTTARIRVESVTVTTEDERSEDTILFSKILWRISLVAPALVLVYLAILVMCQLLKTRHKETLVECGPDEKGLAPIGEKAAPLKEKDLESLWFVPDEPNKGNHLPDPVVSDSPLPLPVDKALAVEYEAVVWENAKNAYKEK